MSIAAVSGAAPAMGLDTMSGASGAGAPPRQKMASLFDSIAGGMGAIDQSQFSAAFATKNPPPVFQKAGADAIWSALDPGKSGSVSRDNFISIMSSLMSSLRAAPDQASAAGAASANTSAQSLQSTGSAGPGSGLDFSV